MPKLKKKKFKLGKIKRHKLRKAIGLKSGFGKPWSSPSVAFRVEFSWFNLDGSEENFEVHWIECRRFIGEERKVLDYYYRCEEATWGEKETIESKFVCVYVANWLVANKEDRRLNQAFIFPTPKKGNETIRMPIYQVKWSENLAKGIAFEKNVEIVLKNSIWHQD